MIKAFVGLGNKGSEYEATYHNVGVFVADQMLHREDAERSFEKIKLYPISGFMNESGAAVGTWLKLHNLLIGDCLVIHDDSDLPVGEYKIARGGGSAGHKGVESLITHFKTEDFWRLRVGVRDPKEQVRKKAGEFVLERWSGTDEQYFRDVAAKACPAVAALTVEPS
jgi:PTH1 family peptidyl-tRNA hydrolase